ncbi:hypothetical protein [Aeoliella straminimaris]|uniref:hypothetical protein n=1 Tax=Aeoliella straminimaris TaxID=2954799 RepID=UPI0020926BDB|nr:hypothetical protein [Aeoliella straminimaris]
MQLLNTQTVGDEGLERFPGNEGNSPFSDARGAECGAVDADSAPIAPDLSLVVERWSELPEAVRAGIVAMVRTSTGEKP